MIDCPRHQCADHIDVLTALKAHDCPGLLPPLVHPIRCECETCDESYYLLLQGNTATLTEILGYPGPPFDPLSGYKETVDMSWTPTAV